MCFLFSFILGSSIANVTVTGTFNVTTQLTNINSTKDVYVSYLIDVTDIILLNTSNMTHVFFGEILFSTMSGVVLSPGDNFTSSGLGIKFSVVGANVTRDAIADMFNVAVDADMFNVTVDRIEEEYNITVACNIYPESMANMCMVVAMGINSSTMPGNIDLLCYSYAKHIIHIYPLMYAYVYNYYYNKAALVREALMLLDYTYYCFIHRKIPVLMVLIFKACEVIFLFHECLKSKNPLIFILFHVFNCT